MWALNVTYTDSFVGSINVLHFKWDTTKSRIQADLKYAYAYTCKKQSDLKDKAVLVSLPFLLFWQIIITLSQINMPSNCLNNLEYEWDRNLNFSFRFCFALICFALFSWHSKFRRMNICLIQMWFMIFKHLLSKKWF